MFWCINMVLVRLDRGNYYFDKVIEVSDEEYKLLLRIDEKYGTIFDAILSKEEQKLIYNDIENRKDLIPEVKRTFFLRQR